MAITTSVAHKYAKDVLAGKIVACRWVKLACERYFYDIETQDEKGFYFDEDAANRVLKFFDFCPHFKGEWAGTPIKLAHWQQFILWNVFGWKWKKDDSRRFKVVYETVGRKNGKTTQISPVGLYMILADGEPGAEVYSVAHDKKQAREVFDAARMMAMSGPLKKKINILAHNLNVNKTASKFEPLTADENAHHGKNIHGALCDELHVWPKRGLWSVLRTGMGARRQPLQWAITTAGTDRNSVCYELHEYTQRILKGFRDGFNDDTFFGIIYTLDIKADWPDLKTEEEYRLNPEGTVEDDWKDESVWEKSNPNLNVSVKLDDLRDEARVAAAVPASLNEFLRLRMNIWTQQMTRWIDIDMWDENYTDEVYVLEG